MPKENIKVEISNKKGLVQTLDEAGGFFDFKDDYKIRLLENSKILYEPENPSFWSSPPSDLISGIDQLSITGSLVNRVIHTPAITPTRVTTLPASGPVPIFIGTTPALHYTDDAQKAYAYAKIQSSYFSNASFHVHWTKNVDTNQSDATVRWVLDYTVFDGESQSISSPTGQIIWDDVYEDSGTTSRIVYRTENQLAPEFVSKYYVSMALGFDPANTTLSGRPVVVSCDILSRNLINLGS
jgi:hypothetical protein